MFRRRRTATLALILGVAIACCGPVAAPAGTTAPSLAAASATPSATPAPTPIPAATSSPTPRASPVAAEEASALATQIIVAERAVRDGRVTGEELAWHAHLQQLTYRRLVERPALRASALALLPADLRPVATANLDAGADLRALITPREKEDLPKWLIVAPAPIDQLLTTYRAAEVEFGVPWQYLAAIHLVETRMGRIRGTSIAGAQGPMQFMPATWAAFGEGDINSDTDAIRAAARYLRHNGAPSNMANALFRYNNSDRYVRAVTGYAEVMRADANAYRGYHGWQVYYVTTQGDVHLPVGYRRD